MGWCGGGGVVWGGWVMGWYGDGRCGVGVVGGVGMVGIDGSRIRW